ncbi:hypothetical protein BGW38_006454 [Lunasporangiospora selenospora]|uniref:Uncharacterized protein n=1 Tax=Lunasporangiospora selenospora TaxID=979761 RepID=A0A9P6FZ11_9FUNG|nr:hypothetical protein BGW38_006454 [Lunasporangiospora selenospora]
MAPQQSQKSKRSALDRRMSSLQSHESSFGEQEHVSSTDSLSVSTSLSSSPENTSDLNDQDSDVAMTMDTQEPGDPPSASTFITPNEQPDEQNQTLPTPASDTAEPATSIKPKTKKGLKSQQSQSQQQPQQSKKKAAAPAPLVRLPGPLPALPKSTPLPYLEDFQLLPEQLKNPLFIAISKVLLVYGNAWQSANDLVGRSAAGLFSIV